MTVLRIAGMRNNACRENVTACLECLPGVDHAQVSLYRAQASIIHECGCRAADFIAAVEGAGYAASLRDRPGGSSR
jgi:copper chaperone CopZ